MKRMPFMTGYKRGDVVLVRFIFSDETGERQRPALIVSSDAYHQSRQEAIIAAITSRTDRILAGDHLISDWQEAGLLFPSVATGVIRTIKQGMIAKKLGTMPLPDMKKIEGNLRAALGLK
jgi:mRNA interferase MazF